MDAMGLNMFELGRQDMVGFVELAGRTCKLLLRQVGLAGCCLDAIGLTMVELVRQDMLECVDAGRTC